MGKKGGTGKKRVSITTAAPRPLNRSLSAANFNKIGLKKLITTNYDGSPTAGLGTLFSEHNEGIGHRPRPTAVGVIVDHVKVDNGDGTTSRNARPRGIEFPINSTPVRIRVETGLSAYTWGSPLPICGD